MRRGLDDDDEVALFSPERDLGRKAIETETGIRQDLQTVASRPERDLGRKAIETVPWR